MCGITGWIDWQRDLTRLGAVIDEMTQTMTNRGPDASGTWLSQHCAFGHRRLSVIDPENGAQPMIRQKGENTYVIVYNGEIYNAAELREELQARGCRFATHCDTEVVLTAYMEWEEQCAEKLNGIFAFAVWNDARQTLFMARDRLGVKPLFYAPLDGGFLFGSEPKAILAHPDFPAEVDQEGLNEIFIVGPARTPGCGVFRNMAEMKPGYCLILDRNGQKMVQYWSLKSHPHTDDVETTASRIYQLLEDTVRRQLISDVPVCTLLSGGLDSSALTALTVKHFREQGKAVDSYSIDYKDNDKYFTASDFTPNADSQWIGKVSDFLQTRHHYIEIDTPELARALTEAVEAKDLPGMADVDSSLLLFCREIKKDATVAISGEAADEVFGGYPWLYRQESLEAATFPWSLRADSRIGVLSPELADWLKPKQYLDERYREALDEVPRLKGENGREARMREMSYLNITRFMPTLLDRKDRMSMRVGLEARVPFCDHRLVEYVWNIPWEMKTAGGREKGILRMALQNILPEDVVYRKKSPYPKTHNPNYMTAVRSQLLEILNDPASPLVPLVNAEKLKQWAASDQDHFDIPWFGQLMKGPQLFAYLIQVDTWLRKYRISIV